MSCNFFQVIPESTVVKAEHIVNVIKSGLVQGVGPEWGPAAIKELERLQEIEFRMKGLED